MKSILFFFLLITALLNNSCKTQQDAALLKINDDTISKAEFNKAYEKNNKHHKVTEPKSVEEYLDLFINFNLKIKEAKSLGLDTVDSFIKEVEEYRKQIAKPYLTDTQVTNQLIKEAYERIQYDIRASHILIAVTDYDSPEDTAQAYNKIKELRNRIVQGEDFGTIAKKYSDDPTAKSKKTVSGQQTTRGYKGDLGYFSALDVIYPFENAAYNTEPGKVSMPVRSEYGYHIIKVTNKIPSPGKVNIAHIRIDLPSESDDNEEMKKQKAEKKINDIYQKALDGEPFDQLAREYSDDRRSAGRKGLLPVRQTSRMSPEFVEAINQIKEPGKFSEPFKTDKGWHIIKLHEKNPIGSYDDMYYELKDRIKRDQRSKLSKKPVIKKLKNEYSFEENPESLKIFYDIVNDSIFREKWTIPGEAELNEELFAFANKSFTQQDFAEFLYQNQERKNPEPIDLHINKRYEEFVNNRLITYEDSQLENKYPEFKEKLEEYRNGILIFEITDKMVWSKAMQDSKGLREFYEKNKEQYKTNKRIDAIIYSCVDEETAQKVSEQLKKYKDQENAHKYILENIIEDPEKKVTFEKGIFERKDKEILKKIPFEPGIKKPDSNNQQIFVVYIHKVIEPKIKPLGEIRGLVIADYQNQIEKEWMENLREKYQVEINKNVLAEIIKKHEQ